MTSSPPCNIGGREIGRRRWFGVAALVSCMAVETAIVVTHASTWWRLLLLPLLYSAIIGLMQAWKGVCIRNAIRGTRNMGAGDELVTDELERSALRGRGLVTIVQAILGAAIITAILMFMPTL